MRTSIEQVLLVAFLLLPLSGCGEVGSSAPATLEESVPGESSSALSGVSKCWDDYNCTGSVIARGISLKACNNTHGASSWRSVGGKCFNL